MKKLNYIDALRGIAILMVIMVHVTGYGRFIDVPLSIRNMVNAGNYSIHLFYIASAFTLFLSWNNRTGKEIYPVRNFFVRRFFRVAPMFYIAIIYYLWQGGVDGRKGWIGVPHEVAPIHLLTNLTFVTGFSPYWIETIVPGSWSVAVEMMFYAVLPLLFFKIRNLSQAFNFLVFTLVLRATLVLFLRDHPMISYNELWQHYLYHFFPNQLPVFALGILMYFFVRGTESLTTISGKSLLIMAFLIVADLISPYDVIGQHVFYGVGFLCLAIALSRYKFTLLVNPVIDYIGKVSFSMYLVHFAVLHWLFMYNNVTFSRNDILSHVILYFIVVGISVGIASIFYYTVEVPFQKVGKKLIRRWERKPMEVQAQPVKERA
jgi:peptidoglycan/LPS O-acetylase OafA/YrhL